MTVVDERPRVVITGATGGIGRAAALELARRGAAVCIVGRDRTRTGAVADEIERLTGEDIDREVADLASLSAVRDLAVRLLDRYPSINALCNNAGALIAQRTTTVDGLETTFAVNHLAPFLLTNLLLDRLRDGSRPARVVTTASDAAVPARLDLDDLQLERRYGGFRAYSRSKLANILFTMELRLRLEGTGVEAVCFHPGVVRTGFARNNGAVARAGMRAIGPFLRSPARGADTLVWLASAPSLPSGGVYFADRRVRRPPRGARPDVAAALWAASERLVAPAKE